MSDKDGQWAERHLARYVSVQHGTTQIYFGKARSTARHAREPCRTNNFRHVTLKSMAQLEMRQNSARQKTHNKHVSLVG